MYLEHFGLENSPFSLTPDPRFLFLTDKHREALAALLFAVTHRKGFMVMTGEAGTGKTTLVRKLLASIPATCAQFSVIVNPALTRSELLESVLLDFGERQLPPGKPLRLALFREYLWRAHRAGRTCVLVIDEAHLLTAELLDEVRLLSNFETTEEKLLQVVLAGQSELDQVLNTESMRPLRQRIAIRMQISPLNQSEVARYLVTRWTRARSLFPLPFSPAAVQLIGRCSEGIPRVMNAICDAALVNACGAGIQSIGVAEVEEVLRDLALISTKAERVASLEPPALLAKPPTSLAKTVPAAASLPLVEPVATKPIRLTSETLASATYTTYATSAPPPSRPPKFWRFANWFGTAGSEAK